jgi:hypothetical protein
MKRQINAWLNQQYGVPYKNDMYLFVIRMEIQIIPFLSLLSDGSWDRVQILADTTISEDRTVSIFVVKRFVSRLKEQSKS